MTGILDKYHNIKWLASGSFGEVYIAQDKTTKRIVLIKNQKFHKDVLTEIEIAKYLTDNTNSEYTTEFIESGEYKIKKTKYIAMVFAHDFMNSLGIINPDSVKESIKFKVVKNAVKGLKKLHSIGIAHTDIKPDNLIIDISTGSVKFIDFGLSCLKHCSIGACAGTIDYMSPERLKCDHAKLLDLQVAKRGDLYALGLVLYDFVYNNKSGKIVFNDRYKKFNKIIEPLLKI